MATPPTSLLLNDGLLAAPIGKLGAKLLPTHRLAVDLDPIDSAVAFGAAGKIGKANLVNAAEVDFSFPDGARIISVVSGFI